MRRLLVVLSCTFRKPFDFFVNFVQLIITMYAHSIQINIVRTTKLHQNHVKPWQTCTSFTNWNLNVLYWMSIRNYLSVNSGNLSFGGMDSWTRKAENIYVKTDLVFNLPFTLIITLQQLFLKKVNKFEYKTFCKNGQK